MWLNFLNVNDMYIYWPVVLVGLTLVILFLPFRVLYHHSRKWWAYSNVSICLFGHVGYLANDTSGVLYWQGCIQLSSGISFWETCTVLRRMLWA